MTLNELGKKSILILGFGTEGQATYAFLRKNWPLKPLAIADRRAMAEFGKDMAYRLQNDPRLTLMLGVTYLDSLENAEVIIKTPGIPASTSQIMQARSSGCILTSHTQIFLSNYPREKIIGVTGTKGKSTTTSLIHHMLTSAGVPAELVGNIGVPPLAKLGEVSGDTYFVHEFSSHQLAEVYSSPHIAVLLNIVPEHLDYYSSFDQYVSAKENITRFQTPDDFFVFNADYPIPNAIAQRTKAALRPFSATNLQGLSLGDISLAGRFNVQNVMAAVTAASLCGIQPATVKYAVQSFRALPHRLEPIGTYRGISFFDDSIATVPAATLGALEALGENVQTLILGGHERNLDFSELGAQIPENVKIAILFPPTGQRIWDAIQGHSKNAALPEPFFVDSMEEAVRIAYARTEQGKICLLSPAAPSFGTFRDYKDRGDSFQTCVRKLGAE